MRDNEHICDMPTRLDGGLGPCPNRALVLATDDDGEVLALCATHHQDVQDHPIPGLRFKLAGPASTLGVGEWPHPPA